MTEEPTTVASTLDVPVPPGVTGPDDDPCLDGRTLMFFLPCTESTPTMQQWCNRTDIDHTYKTVGVDLCEQPPKTLPSTGSTGVALAGGTGLAFVLVGAVLLRLRHSPR